MSFFCQNTHDADTILVAGAVGRRAMTALGEVAITLGCRLLVLMPASLPAMLDPIIIWEGEHPLIQMAVARDHPIRDAVKRAIDVVLASIGLTLTAPVVLLAALAICFESPGSPLLRACPHRTRWSAVPLLEAPHHDRRRGATPARRCRAS